MQLILIVLKKCPKRCFLNYKCVVGSQHLFISFSQYVSTMLKQSPWAVHKMFLLAKKGDWHSGFLLYGLVSCLPQYICIRTVSTWYIRYHPGCSGLCIACSSAQMAHLNQFTLPRNSLLRPKNMGPQVSMEISSNELSAPMVIEKIKILGAVLEPPAKQ